MRNIPADILAKLEYTICHPGDLNRVIYYLSSPEGNDQIEELQRSMDSELDFGDVTRYLADQTRRHDSNRKYREFMESVWGEEDLKKLFRSNDDLHSKRVRSGLIAAYITAIRSIEENTFLRLESVSRYFGVSQGSLQRAASGIDVAVILKKWYCGEKSRGQALAAIGKVIVGEIAAAAGLGVGAATGASIGAYFGPVGGILGGIFGAFGGSYIARASADTIYDMLIKHFFSLDDKALENAYLFLEIDPSATNEEIEYQYRKLARRYHPDAGGSHAQFLRLQMSRDLIRESRKGL